MLPLPLLVALSVGPVAGVLTDAPEVRIARSDVHIGDVARLFGGTARERADLSGLTIARLPSGHRSVSLSRTALADLIRRSSDLHVAEQPGAPLVIRSAGAIAPTGDSGCWAAGVDIAAGAPIGGIDLVEAPCTAVPATASLRFDRASGQMRAGAPIDAGTPLGRLALTPAAAEAGATMTLISRAGPVSVSRTVVALQAGREGRRLFVRDEDGAVMAIRVQPSREARR